MRSGAKLASSGEMVNEAVRVSPCPVKVIVVVAPVTLAVSVPEFVPRRIGVKVTGTVIDWPVDNDAGSVTLGAPMEKLLEYHPNDDTVVGSTAVNVAVSVTDCEIPFAGKFRLVPTRAGVFDASAPKPISVESLVPT